MTSPEPPFDDKPPVGIEVWRIGAAESPRSAKVRIAPELWRPEEVGGHGEAEIARIGERQRGIVTRNQLLEAGITPAAIKHRLEIKRLHSLHPGVYLIGRPRLEPLGAATAAALYFDGLAVLSHQTAGAMWGQTEALEIPVRVTTVDTGYRSRSGLIVRRVNSLSPADVRICKGLPVTSPPRTLVDLAGVLAIDELESALARARRRKLASDRELDAAIGRAPWSKGVANLRKLLAEGAQPRLIRSVYEAKLLRLVNAAQLPRRTPNALVQGKEVDFLWPEHRLVVEFDSAAFHMDRAAFEKDRLRDQQLTAAGYRVIRITARQLDTTPEAVLARIAQALAQHHDG